MERNFKLVVLLLVVMATAICGSASSQTPKKVIFDTDMGPDYDDVGAIALLHAFADKGEVEILATMASTKYNGVASVLDVLNTYFGRADLPLGVPKGNALLLKDFQHWTDTLIARYPHSIKKYEEAENAITLYRRILATQPDQSVTIITVGFLTNIAALLKSPPDGYSPLSGIKLVEKKVSKLVSMAGGFPSGHEFNVKEDAAASEIAFKNFPRPILFSGVEIGFTIKTGLKLINNSDIINSPVKDVFRIGIASAKEDVDGRWSWDQTAVLVAVRGHEPWYSVKEGKIQLDSTGRNTWDDSAKGHFYLFPKLSPEVVAKTIEELMMHQPMHSH